VSLSSLRILLISAPLLFAFACAEEEPPPAVPSPPPPPPAASVAPVASAAPAAPGTPPPPPEPTPEEKKKAEELRKLQEERAKWEEDRKVELARWTPEAHTAAKALAEKKYPDLKAAIKAVLSGPQRTAKDVERDKSRHPAETLAFFGISPSMTVLEVAPGDGWYTAILAPTLAVRGKLLVAIDDPNGPDDSRPAFYAQRYKGLLQMAPELYGKVEPVVADSKVPNLDAAGSASVDAVLVMREVHGMINSGALDAWLTQIHKVLKPGGVLGIEEHRAKPDADPEASSKKGYVPEKWLVEKVQGFGFKLAGSSELNANPKDTKDYEEGVWALPPTLRQGDKDRDKYLAIGESDRMTLKFTKIPESKAGLGGIRGGPGTEKGPKHDVPVK
jgi:predicted methyltransferase